MNKNKILASALIATSLVTSATPAFAYTTSSQSVTDASFSEDTTQETNVSCEIASNFKVEIPKDITLSGATKKGNYEVKVQGDISGTESINVVPDSSMTLSTTDKKSVSASITQDKTAWAYNEMDTVGNGEIDASLITAGSWNGTFNFNISDVVGKEAGLYDADGNMICSLTAKQVEATYTVDSNLPTTLGVDSSKIAEIIIPEGTTNIGYLTFYNCTNLTSVTIPDSVTCIREDAFDSCTSLTSVTIPDSVTEIRYSAFYNCTSLTSVTIPDSITRIDVGVFASDTSLTSVTIPDSVTSIGNSAFDSCTSLTSVTIPDSVTSIGIQAFKNCTSLTSVTIPNSVTDIESEAFYNVQHIYYTGTATGSPWGALAIN